MGEISKLIYEVWGKQLSFHLSIHSLSLTLEYSLEFWAKGTYSEIIYPRPQELHHEPEIKHFLCSFWSKMKTVDLLYFNTQIKTPSGESAASANTFIQENKLFVILDPVSVFIQYQKDGEMG